MVTLIIAEKPNVARTIAHALAEGKPVRKTIGKVSYYEFTRDGKRIIVAPAVGHLFSLAPKDKTYGYPVFDIEWVPVYVAEKGKGYAKDYIRALATLARQADEFIVACDYDTEGEVIGYTALKYACGVDPSKAKRMKFSALTKKDILNAWYNLEPTINFGMADAGIARHVLDWYWGVNLSRALSSAIKRASGKWMVLSTGRVQGPTLKFLVEREKEIQSFTPTPYWVIKMLLEKNGEQHTATYEKERILDEEEAKKIVEEAKKGPAFVEKVEVKQQQRNPPVPFDLGTLQREAYSAFGYSPKKTLDIAQKLYEKGYCLHPDSLIPTPEGIKRIKELPKEGEVFALDFDLKLSRARYRLLERDADEPMYKVVLGDRTELYLTGDHPVLVYRDDRLIFVPAGELRDDDQVVFFINRGEFRSPLKAPRLFEFILRNATSMKDYILYEPSFGGILRERIKQAGLKVEILWRFKIKEPTYYKYLRGKMPVPIVKFLVERGIISMEELNGIFLGFSYGTSLSSVKFEFGEEFWYLYGFVLGDGHLEKKGTITISAKEREEETLRAIREVANALGVPISYDRKYRVITLRSKSLTRLFELLGCPYGNKTEVFRVHGLVMSKPEWMASFLAGYYDADAHIGAKPTGSKKSMSPQIVLTSKNRQAIYSVKLMWQLLGVGTYLWEKKEGQSNFVAYELKVYSRDALRFYEIMRKYLRVKRQDLENVREVAIRKRKSYSPHYSVLRVRNWRGKLKTDMAFLKKFDMSNQTAHGSGISLDKLERIRDYLINEDLRRIATGDVYILPIKEIKKFHYRGKVYDLVVDEYHNFIANGVVVHNCSYPRTSSQKLPKNLNFRGIIQNLAKLPEYKPFAHELLGRGELKPIEGKKEDPAHPAIYPTGELPKPEELTKDEQNLYDLIVRRFLALFMEPAVRETMKVVINSNSHRFILSGARTLKEGWLRVYGKYVEFEEVVLPPFKEGEPVNVLQIKREKKMTKPPARYSPAAVIKKMEDLGIGTKATRAQILETLYQRGYIEGKRKIKVTPLGMRVVEALEKNVPDIVSVELTKAFEEKMEDIMAGKAKRDEVIEESKEELVRILRVFKEKELDIGRMLLESTGTGVTPSKSSAEKAGAVKESEEEKMEAAPGEASSGNAEGKEPEKKPLVIGKCPKCGGDLVVRYNRKTGKRFAGCSNWPRCDVTYPLLQRGEIIPTDKTCCNGVPVVKVREGKKEYEVCLDMNCKERENS
ncbi:DNA topoisomerase I [Thermococcus waiotapuensis]|uniref:DNA topoisomerase 1 n=1 Tax=Thermococcus waiotapuensis TaxID=90909 RepID=A0AAE4SYG4_9EURY|nr:DNA topoisomerase I [Thermococcus waiotapuensis]MDV3103704.1 DNA topoisomerase I [Thermococcus waiotapuensis]